MENYFPVNYPEMIVEKSNGLTTSEKKLISLGYDTFLRLWSYPNPYKMQQGGKELCDLLVVFENNIIIFSDKECAYGKSGNDEVDWRRWYKKAIKKSANQLLGAKAWIEKYPDKISLDAKGEKPFPIRIRITPETQFHLISISHGASTSCKEFFSGGDGGLIINSSIIGEMHTDKKCEPFQIGIVEEDIRNFIHIFDDISYATVLKELDTIEDFTNYLNERKKLLFNQKILAAGENELLSQHISGLIDNNKTVLSDLCQSNYSEIIFEAGQWEELISSTRYIKWRKRLRKSYFWDVLLQKTFFFIENGLSAVTTCPDLNDQSILFQRLAKQNRLQRLALSESFLSFFASVPPGFRGTRIMFNKDESDLCFLLFLLPRKSYMSDENYRRVRREMLYDYCAIAKTDFPQFPFVIGVAHESSDTDYGSEDFVLLDSSNWTDEDFSAALQTKHEYQAIGLLKERTIFQKIF